MNRSLSAAVNRRSVRLKATGDPSCVFRRRSIQKSKPARMITSVRSSLADFVMVPTEALSVPDRIEAKVAFD